MVPNGKVEFVWGDGEHTFNIAKIAQALELEEKCGCGVAEIFDRLRNGRWYVNDLRETIRLGLIGGGMEPVKAHGLVKRYADERPWAESLQPATIIMMAAMVGVLGDQVGKKTEAERTTEGETPSSDSMVDSSAPQSMGSDSKSDGHQEQPTSTPSGNLPPQSKASIEPTVPSST